MFSLSPRFMMSPRFFALPLIALAVIVALANASSTTTRPTGAEMATQKVKATVCTSERISDPACAVVRNDTRIVR